MNEKSRKPSDNTDIRRTILANVPESQRMHPVFVRMKQQTEAGLPIPPAPMIVAHKSPEKMQ